MFGELLIGYAIETLVAVPIVLIFSMIIALFLNLRFRLKGVFRTIFFLPVVITSGPVIKELTEQGAASAPGIANVPAVAEFLAQLPTAVRNPVEYLLVSFILILWFSGVQILIYLASLQKVDQAIYEAAAIDGASAWESFWKITLPSLTTATVVNAVYTIVTLSHFSENKVVRYIYGQTYASGRHRLCQRHVVHFFRRNGCFVADCLSLSDPSLGQGVELRCKVFIPIPSTASEAFCLGSYALWADLHNCSVCAVDRYRLRLSLPAPLHVRYQHEESHRFAQPTCAVGAN